VNLFRRWSGAWRALPSFLIAGAQRCGTTSLCDYLRRHPDVYLPGIKEVHYFDNQFGRSLDWYRSFFPLRGQVERHRRRCGRELAIGESSPYYLFHPEVPGRVFGALPDVRVVCLLRHPTERAFSQFRHERRLGFEEEVSLRRALELEASRMEGARTVLEPRDGVHPGHNHGSYTGRGEYAPQLRRWIEVFGRERVHVLISEELFQDAAPVLARLCRFLDLRDDVQLGDLPRNNATIRGEEDAEVRRALDAHFRPGIEELEELLGRPTGWLDPGKVSQRGAS